VVPLETAGSMAGVTLTYLVTKNKKKKKEGIRKKKKKELRIPRKILFLMENQKN